MLGPDVDERDDAECVSHSRKMLTACGSWAGAIFSTDRKRRLSGAQPDASGSDIGCGGQVKTPTSASGREWQNAQSGQGAAELVLPRPGLGEMQGEAADFAGDAPGHGEEASPEGLGSCHQFVQSVARRPASQLWASHPVSSTGQALYGRPALAGKRPEGIWFSPTPYFRSGMVFSIPAWRRSVELRNIRRCRPAGHRFLPWSRA